MKNKKVINLFITFSVIFGFSALVKADTENIKPIIGTQYISTSYMVAEQLKSTSNTIVITSREDFPDALAGAILASKLNAPIIFVSEEDKYQFENLPLFLKQSIGANAQTKFFILGGEGVLSKNVEEALNKISNIPVKRLAGANRYDTCQQISQYINVKQGTPVIISSGNNYPDALAISGVGGQLGYPILLVEKDNIPSNILGEITKIKPSTVYIVGGTGVVSDAIKTQLINIGMSSIVRLGGQDRYETAALIADNFKNVTTSDIYVTGQDFHAALSAAPLAAKEKASIILIDNNNYRHQLAKSRKKGYIISTVNDLSEELEGYFTGMKTPPLLPETQIENDWYEIKPDLPRRLYNYTYPYENKDIFTNKEIVNRINKEGQSSIGFNYVDMYTSKDLMEAMYNNNPDTIDRLKILHYYNPYAKVGYVLDKMLNRVGGVWAEDIVNPFVNERKQYHVSSTAQFITDKSLWYYSDYHTIVRGTLKIKFDNSTDQTYLKRLGVQPDVWYEKDFEVYWYRFIQRTPDDRASIGWDYTAETISQIKELSNFIPRSN